MNSDKPFQHLNDEDLAILHVVSESFEDALRTDKSARIDVFIERIPANLRADAFADLLAIELEWRSAQQQYPTQSEYLERYPAFAAEIQQCFSAELSANALDLAGRGTGSVVKVASQGPAAIPIVTGSIVDDRYAIVRLIGEGGMGSVYLADQREPVKRQVAIKFIKEGMDSKSVQTRFELERQALALMDHPGIAKIFDGGKAANGLNYFVMEYVPGVALTRYCDDNQLDVNSRLQLFVSVCYAVQHAHSKGIIHRDLKPGNILVVDADGKPRAKVIDFGVAKAIDQKLAGQSLAATAMIVGTPVYMSPEQADPKSMDIDIRTDVYALGVILYELLAGTPPHDSDSVPRGNVLELLRLIRDVDSPRPSTKVKSSESLFQIAANRNIDPQKLGPLLKGELDWIALKAIEKDRSRRYATVAGLQQDIERYLAGEMVEARPPSRAYRMQKFVRRNRWEVITASLLVLFLQAGICGTTWGMMSAQWHAQKARDELIAKEAALEREAQERKFAEGITEFVEHDFLALTSLEGRLDFDEPQSGINKDSTLRDLLDRAAKKLNNRKDLNPRIEARLRSIIGNSYLNLGVFSNAVDSFQRDVELCIQIYGAEHVETATAQLSLAKSLLANGNVDSAKTLLTELVVQASLLGEDRREQWLNCRRLLGQAHRQLGEPKIAVEILQQTLEVYKTILAPSDHAVLTNMYELALALNDSDQRAAALTLLEETLMLQTEKFGEEHPDVQASTNKIGELYCKFGRFKEAKPLLEKCLQWSIANYGPKDHNTIYSMARLVILYRELGEIDLAVETAERNLELSRQVFENDHQNIANALGDLAVTYKAAGKSAAALPLFEEVLERRKKDNGPRHPSTLISLINFAACLKAVGQTDKAHELNLQALDLSQELHGQDHSLTITIKQNLANSYWSEKKFDLSIPLFEEVLSFREAKNGRQHLQTLVAIANVGVNYRDAGRFAEAIPLLQEVCTAADSQPSLKYVEIELLEALNLAKETEKADSLLTKLLAKTRSDHAADSLSLATAFAKVARVLVRTEQFEKATPLLRESLDVRTKQEPGKWTTYDTMALLGEALLEQKDYAQAEPLLVQAIQGMATDSMAAEKARVMRCKEVIALLNILLHATGRSHEAANRTEEGLPPAAP